MMLVAQNLKKERAVPLDHLPQGDGIVPGMLVRYRLRVKLLTAYDLELSAYPIWTVAPLIASAVCGLRAPSLKRMVSCLPCCGAGGTYIRQGKMD